MIDHLGSLTLTHIIAWWSDKVENMFLEFPDPENHIVDTKNTCVWLLLPEKSTIDHLSGLTLTYKVTWLSDNVENMFFGFSDPENHIVDTKNTSLWPIVPEKFEHLWLGGHLGRHLEYLLTARNFELTPSFFLNCVIFWRDWHPTHTCIISQPTGLHLLLD